MATDNTVMACMLKRDACTWLLEAAGKSKAAYIFKRWPPLKAWVEDMLAAAEGDFVIVEQGDDAAMAIARDLASISTDLGRTWPLECSGW
jgi:predicted lipoprotein with Yx(FWY)xxD motif